MLNSYKNGFLDIINEVGIDQEKFRSFDDKDNDHNIFIIELIKTPLKFIVRTSPRNFRDLNCRHTLFGPAFLTSEIIPGKYEYTSIKEINVLFKKWLDAVVKPYCEELLIPNLWERINQNSEAFLGDLNEQAMSLFTEEEKEQTKFALHQFTALISEEFKPSQTEMAFVNKRIDYLSEALDRLNRTDWKGLAISTLITISTALALDTNQGKVLFGLFKKVFSHILFLLQ
jgi:hypothetical protein